MLSVFLGNMEGAIYHPPTYFDNQYENEWITDEQSVKMIRDIDHSDVISAHLIQSPVLGAISAKDLSGGVKTLILMAHGPSEKIFNASACGDNCAKWMLRIAEQRDLTVNLRHIMDFGSGNFVIRILNTGDVVYNMSEFVQIAGKYV